MTLTFKQQEVYDEVMDFFNAPKGYGRKFVISGYAGTGKTYLLAEIVKGLNSKIICATTHKAKKVLQQKMKDAGIKAPVETIHSQLYVSPIDALDHLLRELEQPRKLRRSSKAINREIHAYRSGAKSNLSFVPRESWDDGLPKNLIVDEASMLNKELADIAERLELNMLYVGDGMQLPPVKAKEGVNLRRANKVLTEILRTAEDSQVPHVAKLVRESDGRNLRQIMTGAMKMYPDTFVDTPISDAVNLTWTNKKRAEINGNNWKHAEMLVEGEMYQVYSSQNGYISGENIKLLEIIEPANKDSYLAKARLEFTDRENVVRNLSISTTDLDMQSSALRKNATKAVNANKSAELILTLPYATTVHKSQGSEYENVNIYCTGRLRCGTLDDRTKWLYTAITRSKNKIYIEF